MQRKSFIFVSITEMIGSGAGRSGLQIAELVARPVVTFLL